MHQRLQKVEKTGKAEPGMVLLLLWNWYISHPTSQVTLKRADIF